MANDEVQALLAMHGGERRRKEERGREEAYSKCDEMREKICSENPRSDWLQRSISPLTIKAVFLFWTGKARRFVMTHHVLRVQKPLVSKSHILLLISSRHRDTVDTNS